MTKQDGLHSLPSQFQTGPHQEELLPSGSLYPQTPYSLPASPSQQSNWQQPVNTPTPLPASPSQQSNWQQPINPTSWVPQNSWPEQRSPQFPSASVSQQKALRPSRTSSFLMQRKKRLLLISGGIGVAVLLGALVFYIWMVSKSTPAVTLYQVGAQNVTQNVGGGGIVFPKQEIDLSYPFAERVTAVLVNPGDEVSPNQPLLQLDPTQLNAQVTQASNDMAAAQAYLNTVSAGGNPTTIAQAQQAYNLAKNKYSALVAQTSSPLLHDGALISPMSGVVTTVNVSSGEVFSPDTSLLTLMDESKVVVHVKVPLSNLGQVHVGESAVVTPSALPTQNFNGTVSAIIPQADPQTDTFEVWVEVANMNKTLLPGMSAFVRIESSGKAIVVPRLAVLNPDRESAVFVVRNKHVYIQHVEVAGRTIDSIFIASGLSIGDYVVLVGLYALQNGEAVIVHQVEG